MKAKANQTRRGFLKALGAGALALAGGGLEVLAGDDKKQDKEKKKKLTDEIDEKVRRLAQYVKEKGQHLKDKTREGDDYDLNLWNEKTGIHYKITVKYNKDKKLQEFYYDGNLETGKDGIDVALVRDNPDTKGIDSDSLVLINRKTLKIEPVGRDRFGLPIPLSEKERKRTNRKYNEALDVLLKQFGLDKKKK